MKRPESFPLEPLEFALYGHINNSAIMRLTSPYRYASKKHQTIDIPADTLTDGASIPRIFWGILAPHGSYFRAAIVHDYLYSKASTFYYPEITRAEADHIFLQAMDDCGVGFITRHTIHRAVRLGGWASYKKK